MLNLEPCFVYIRLAKPNLFVLAKNNKVLIFIYFFMFLNHSAIFHSALKNAMVFWSGKYAINLNNLLWDTFNKARILNKHCFVT